MILMIYINGSNIFILIYPCYISILLYRLYSTILCILLSCCFIYPGIFIPAYILLCTFMMIHRHEHIYSIHLPILSMLSSLHAFIAFIASMLLYFYMIHISLQPPVLALVLSSIWEVYSFYPLGVCSTGAQCTWDTQGIYFLYTFLALYMIHCTNYIPAFI